MTECLPVGLVCTATALFDRPWSGRHAIAGLAAGWHRNTRARILDAGDIQCEVQISNLGNKTSASQTLSYGRCYKDLLQSYDGNVGDMRIVPGIDHERQTIPFDSPSLANSTGLLSRLRPQACWFSVDQGSLVLGQPQFVYSEQPRVGNLAHSAGAAGWVFTSDNHLIWRVKNACLHWLYEHGIVGLTSIIVVQIVFLSDAWHMRRRLSPEHFSVLCGLGGFASVMLVGSLVDTPALSSLAIAVAGLWWNLSVQNEETRT
ncbi:hypothetical protein Pla22_23090 [Rubripirellula amarantea]|uniref:Uncharacterized protein n=1 Tax=Rubripirellula amarantea TaxID=2527999 RepID=A0A5C5WWR0_9BACT|nr:hypothetical protein [Rubripirellula amarantea]TWT54659.1 hypothetical protein Pla22_23090 [Rubripirellula amarantea]